MKLVIAKGIFRRIDEAIFLERSRRIAFCEIARRVAILRDSKICELIWFKPVFLFQVAEELVLTVQAAKPV